MSDVPPETRPRSLLSDPERVLQEELARLEQAEMGTPTAPPQQAQYAPPIGYQSPEADYAPPVTAPREPKSLEDIWAFFPQIGVDPLYRVRIERMEPKQFNGIAVAGILGDFHEKIDLGTFMGRFGGHKYKVTPIGPVANARKRDDGAPVIRTLTQPIMVTIPGPPNMQNLPQTGYEENPMTGGFGRTLSGMTGMAEPPQVQVRKIDADQERWKAENDERNELRRESVRMAQAGAQAPTQLLDAVRDQAQQTVERMERAHETQMASMQQQLNDWKERCSKLEDETRRAKEKAMEDRLNDATRNRGIESEQLRSINERHEIETRRLSEQHRDTLERLNEQHRNDLTAITNRHVEERQRIESDGSRERERLTKDAADREARLKDSADRDRQSMKEQYDLRLSDIERSYAREVATLRDVQARESVAVKSQFETQATLSKETAALRIENNQGEVQRLRNETERMRAEIRDKDREIDEARRAQIKPPVQAIGEAKELLETLGMEVGKPGGGGEEEGDWKKLLIGGVRDAIGKLPDTIKEIRGMNQQAAVQAQQVQMEQARVAQINQARAAEQNRVRQLQGRNGRMISMPTYTPATAAPVGPTALQNPSVGTTSFQPQDSVLPMGSVNPIMQTMGPPPAQSPTGNMGVDGILHGQGQPIAPPFGAQPFQPQPAPQPRMQEAQSQPQQATAQQPAAEQQAQPSAESAQVAEGAAEFIRQLDMAINAGFSAADFAKAFVEKAGIANAAATIAGVQLDGDGGLFALVQKAREQGMPFGKAVITRDGQKYTREMWDEARKILVAAGAIQG